MEPLNLKFGNKNLTHEFLYMPECPVSLIGRDLLRKVKAQISFENRLVQDLRAINLIVKDIHPVVANPYTL